PGTRAPRGPAPEYSVLVALGSRPQDRRLPELLQALAAGEDAPAYEVVAAVREGDAIPAVAADASPALRVVTAPRDASLPRLRLAALDAARGEMVAVIGDYCVPGRGWLAAMAAAFRAAPPETVAVGGAVAPGERIASPV